jgi:2-dehydropantoate 2-reductase
MRFVVVGAGAIGSLVGARLTRAGRSVVVVGRGAHMDSLRDRGLILATPVEQVTTRLTTSSTIEEVRISDGDVVLLCVQSQDTDTALKQLFEAGGAAADAVVCMQNGVANERAALRFFPNVYGACVLVPAVRIDPGRVDVYTAPLGGVIDVGRYPDGTDQIAERVCEALQEAGFDSQTVLHIMENKYAKLMLNLTAVIEALCGSAARQSALADRVVREARQCLDAAHIRVAEYAVSPERAAAGRPTGEVDGRHYPGGSASQSLARDGSVEVNYINGEVVLLGRLLGIDTPVNRILQVAMHDARRDPAARTLGLADLNRLVDTIDAATSPGWHDAS